MVRPLPALAGVVLLCSALPVHAFDPVDPLHARDREAAPPSVAAPAATGALTLPDAVKLALANNPRLASAWAAVRVEGAGVGLAEAAFLPTLAGELQAGRSDSGQSVPGGLRISEQANASLALNYLLFDFGGRQASRDAARETLAAANSGLVTALQDLYLDVARGYFTLAGLRASLAANQAAEAAARESLSAAQTRYRAGAGTPADRLQAQTAYSQAVLTRIKAEGDQRNARGALANLMGLAPTAPVKLAAGEPAVPNALAALAVERLITQALDRRPDLAAGDARVRAAQAQVAAARAAGLPTVSVGANVGATWSRQQAAEFNTNNIGVTVSLPLFTGFQSTYRIAQARAQAEQLQADRAQLAQAIALDVWTAYQDLVTEDRALATALDLVASADQSEQVARGRYKAGIGNILDLLTAQSALASALQQEVAARYRLALAKVTLVHAVGGLELATFTGSAR